MGWYIHSLYRLLGRGDKVNKTEPSSFKVTINIIINKRDMTNTFNKCFTSIARELDSKLPPLDSISSEQDLPCSPSGIFISRFTTYEFCDIIAKIKFSSRGMNGVSGNLLKCVRYINCEPLIKFISCSFERGLFIKSKYSSCNTLI